MQYIHLILNYHQPNIYFHPSCVSVCDANFQQAMDFTLFRLFPVEKYFFPIIQTPHQCSVFGVYSCDNDTESADMDQKTDTIHQLQDEIQINSIY